MEEVKEGGGGEKEEVKGGGGRKRWRKKVKGIDGWRRRWEMVEGGDEDKMRERMVVKKEVEEGCE